MTEFTSLPVIQAEALFDQAFYLAQNEDVARQSGIDPIAHFLSYGGLEGRDPHPLFDSSFYLEKNPFLVADRINPLIHFLEQGASQGLDPHPLFSTAFYLEQGLTMKDCSYNPLLHYLEVGSKNGKDPHPLFDGKFYQEQLAKIEKKNNEINPLVHYLTIGSALGLQPSPEFDAVSYSLRYRDVAQSGVNPLLHYVTQGKQEGRIKVAISSHVAKDQNYQAALCKILADTKRPFSHLIVTSCLARGGSERCVANFAEGIAQRVGPENLVILVTDFQSITCGDWLPRDVRIVNLLQVDPGLSEEQRGLLFLDLLMIRQPAFALGMNAATFWNSLDGHAGMWKGKLKTKLVGYLGHYEPFVNENDYGFIEGPLSRLIDDIHLFITDNIRLRDAMLEHHKDKQNLHSKVTVCYKSLAERLHESLSAKAASTPRTFKKILWASRFTKVKQPHILWQIAEQMPDLQFSVYGRKMPHEEDLSFLRPLPNVTLMDEYAGFEDIDTNDVGAFLYTSCADSMPHVLVEAGASGLPVVAPDIGAIRELIDEQTGWLLPESEDVEAYVRALRYLQAHPQIALERAKNLKDMIDTRHNWSAFIDRLNLLDIWQANHMQADILELFDSEYYLEQNPDLAEKANLNPWRHFLEKGGLEGRDPHPLFDSSFYMENPEVAELQVNPLAHFIHEGARRLFDPHPLFSVAFYLQQAPDILEHSSNPLIHYLEYGAKSGLNPHPLFDSHFYTRQVERLEGKPVACNPLVHYLCEGARLGLNPSPKFDGKAYYKRHPDVKKAGVNPLIHFITVGQAEGRASGAGDTRHLDCNQRLRDLKINLLRRLGLDKKLAFRERITVLAEKFEIPIVQGYGAELLHFEPSFTYELLNLFQKYLTIDEFVDIGAHIGQTLLEVRLASSDIRYVGFEPNPLAYRILTELIKANRFDYFVHQLGVSDKQEVVKLFRAEPLDGAATILPNTRPGKYAPDDCEQIECVRLDDIEEIQSLHKHFFLKIDVEGAELKVLRGARQCISRLRPIIICEVLHAHNAQTLSQSRENKKQIQTYLDELNFLLYQIELNPGQNHRQSLKSVRRISEFPVSIYSRSPHTCEYLFLPEELGNAIPF